MAAAGRAGGEEDGASGPMWCYRLGRSLYVHVTSAANSTTLVQSRGPGFKTPFLTLGATSSEPSAEQLALEIRQELQREPAEAVVLAGLGEPTMRLGTVLTLAAQLRGSVPALRLNTNGLGSLEHGRDIVEEIRGAGFTSVSVTLNAATPARHRCTMRPRIKGRSATPAEGFGAACDFIAASARAFPPGSVEVTCVEGPGVNAAAVELHARQLAPAVAELSFRARSFHPLAPTEGVASDAHLAAHSGDLAALAAVEGKALDAADDQGNPPIVWAGNAGHAEAVRLLADRGCFVDAQGKSGNTALHRACNQAHAAAVSALIEAKAGLDALNCKQQTALHHAAFYQHGACVRVLLDAGADPTKRDARGKTPAEDTADETIEAELVAAAKAWHASNPRL